MIDASALLWVGWTLGVLAAMGAAAPFIRTGAWMVRLWDFPRVQLLVVAAVAGVVALAAAWSHDFDPGTIALLVLVAGAIGTQAFFILPYTRAWRVQVPAAGGGLRLLVMNLDYTNDRHAEVADRIRSLRPDILVLVELDETWRRGLAEVRGHFQAHVEDVRGEGLGLALWSRVPLEAARVEHLVSPRRPSITADLDVDGVPARLVCLHPTPPGLEVRRGDGRYDSRIRDAELSRVALRIAEQRSEDERAWIVAGDFNDVAWSHTTRLFLRTSGLLDPRIGRGMFNTYHADHPLWRYPLDHVFLSRRFGVDGMRRIRTPGSDHFAMAVEIGRLGEPREAAAVAEAESEAAPPGAEERREAAEHVREGRRDAAEGQPAASG